MSKWIEEKIGNIGEIVTGNTPPTKNQELYGDRYKFIKATDICEDSRTVIKTEEMLSDEGFKKYRKSLLPKGTTCVVTIGTLGKKLCYTDEPCFTNQAINAIKQYEDYDSMFIYYQMKLLLPQVKFLSSGTASGRENVSKSSFSNIKMRFPDLPTQKRIADILSVYDDLIENNNKRIDLLEKAAQELYKEWFVRFRFPGHENTKFVNGLPEGWEYGRLKDIMSFGAGKTRPDSDGSFPVYGGNGILGYCDLYNNENVIIIGRVGAYCGSVYYEPNKCWISDNALYAIDKLDALIYDYYLLKSLQLNSRHIGTGQPLITQGLLNKIKIVIPNKDLIKKYNNLAQDLFVKQNLLKKQNQNFTKQRDLLLPRLMSGKLEV